MTTTTPKNPVWNINFRIKFVLMAKNLTQVQLAEHMGFELPKGKARISNQLRGEDTDSIKLVTAVSEITGAYLTWIILGKGPMFLVGEDPLKSEIPITSDEAEKYWHTELDKLERRFEEMKRKPPY